MWAERIDWASHHIMLGVLGLPGLALFLGQETVGLCLGLVVLRKLEEGCGYKPLLSRFPLYLGKAFFTGTRLLVFIVGTGLNFLSNETSLHPP